MAQKEAQELVEIYNGQIKNIGNHINTIGFHATRLKAVSPTNVFIAINNNLYEINIVYPSQYKLEKGRQGPFISRPIELENIKILNHNKSILSTKHPIQNINVTKDNNNNKYYIISCIDNHGIIYTKKYKIFEHSIDPPPLKKRKLNTNTNTDNTNINESSICNEIFMKHDNALNNLFLNNNNKHSNGLLMPGYCSFDMNYTNNKFAAISNYYNLLNIGCINDRNKPIGSMYLSQKPTAIKYYEIPKAGNNSSVILITEGNILSVWDERQLNKCIKRINLKNKMYSIDINNKSESKYISCCGLSKIVYVIDPFKWNIHSMWKSQSKYSLLKCTFSQFDKYGKYMYCIGMDSDFLCGQWETSGYIHNKNKNKNKNKNNKKEEVEMSKPSKQKTTKDLRFQYCFRGDSNWIGVDYVSHKNYESMIGITNTAKLYVAHKPHILDVGC